MDNASGDKYVMTWGQAAKIWWSITWRQVSYTLVLLVVFVALGAALGFMSAASGKPLRREVVSLTFGILSFLCSVPLSILAIKMALTKHINRNTNAPQDG